MENPEMAASLCCTLLFLGFIEFVSADHKRITAKSGQNSTLPCRAANADTITAVEWKRADLGEEYVLLYRDGWLDQDSQHPSFKNRVDLQDRQLKDGNVSLIVMNVTVNDTGTYECEVLHKTQERLKLIIELFVVPPGPPGGDTEDGGKEDGSVGLTVGLLVPAVLLAAVVGFFIYRKHKQQQSSDQPSLEEKV